jgi:hypothetical protein
MIGARQFHIIPALLETIIAQCSDVSPITDAERRAVAALLARIEMVHGLGILSSVMLQSACLATGSFRYARRVRKAESASPSLRAEQHIGGGRPGRHSRSDAAADAKAGGGDDEERHMRCERFGRCDTEEGSDSD